MNTVAERRRDRESEIMDGCLRRTGPGACAGFTRLVDVEIPWLAAKAGNDARYACNGPANHRSRMKNSCPAATEGITYHSSPFGQGYVALSVDELHEDAAAF